jgi:hypothetical protein
MKKYLIVALLASLLAGCAHDSPCVPVYDSQGRLVHTNTCMKGTTEDNWDTAGAIAGGRRGSRPHVRDRRADSLASAPQMLSLDSVARKIRPSRLGLSFTLI